MERHGSVVAPITGQTSSRTCCDGGVIVVDGDCIVKMAVCVVSQM